MRIILFFDLPTITKKNRKEYRNFVKNMKKTGFFMIQESVYARFCLDQRAVESAVEVVKTIAPKKGSVMLFSITEKQFNSMTIILGDSTSDVITGDMRVVEL